MDKKEINDTSLSWEQNIVLYLKDLLSVLIGMVIVFLLFFRVIVVSGSSMYDTLIDGDYLLLVRGIFYQEPEQGDIIVASKKSHDGGAPVIKRVIATEGQTVDIDFVQGIVYVDGLPLEEDYTYTPTNIEEGMDFPLLVEENCIFAMGDNRNVSKDSRHPDIGLIDQREILGRAVFLVIPGTDEGKSGPDYSRIGAIK